MALVGAVLLTMNLGLFPVQWTDLEDSPARVAFVAWYWLPSRLLAVALGLLALPATAGTLALAAGVVVLLLRPAPTGADGWRCYTIDGARRATSRGQAVGGQGVALLLVLGLAAAFAGTSYAVGTARRMELDLAGARYRSSSVYLWAFTVRDEERPLQAVEGATYDAIADGEGGTVHRVTLVLADGRSDWIVGPQDACREAADAFQRALARARPKELPERPAPR